MGIKYFLFFDCIDVDGKPVKLNSIDSLNKPIQTQDDIDMIETTIKLLHPNLNKVTLSNFIEITNTTGTSEISLDELTDCIDDVKELSENIRHLYSVKQAEGVYILPDELMKFKNELSICSHIIRDLERKLKIKLNTVKESKSDE